MYYVSLTYVIHIYISYMYISNDISLVNHVNFRYNPGFKQKSPNRHI